MAHLPEHITVWQRGVYPPLHGVCRSGGRLEKFALKEKASNKRKKEKSYG